MYAIEIMTYDGTERVKKYLNPRKSIVFSAK